MTIFHVLNLLGAAVFAVSGVLAAAQKRLDLLGVVVIAIVTAIGGGTLRDLLLDRHPIFWFHDEHLLVIVIAALLTLGYLRVQQPPERALAVADAVGLAVFTISGVEVARAAGYPFFVAVIMGVMTGVAGGVLRDVLLAEIPLILRRGELYATAAIAGAVVYLLTNSLFRPPLPTIAAIALIVVVRLASIFWGLRLPAYALPEE